jgi:hypothetical protein
MHSDGEVACSAPCEDSDDEIVCRAPCDDSDDEIVCRAPCPVDEPVRPCEDPQRLPLPQLAARKRQVHGTTAPRARAALKLHPTSEATSRSPAPRPPPVLDARSLICLFGTRVGLDSMMFSEERAKALLLAEELRTSILEWDLDVIAHARFENERRLILRIELAKSAAKREKSERKRLAEGRNKATDDEFELRERIRHLLDEQHPLKSDGVRELMLRRGREVEAAVAEADAPELKAAIRAGARGARVLGEEALLQALAVTASVDTDIARIVADDRRSKAHVDFVRKRSDQIRCKWPANVPGRDLVCTAFDRQSDMSLEDGIKLTIWTLANREEHLRDGLQSTTTAASALAYLLEKGATGLARAATAVGSVAFAMPESAWVDPDGSACEEGAVGDVSLAWAEAAPLDPTPRKRVRRVRPARVLGEHRDADVRALKYSLLEGFVCPFPQRREFFYLWKDSKICEQGGQWMLCDGSDGTGSKLTPTKLARGESKRDATEASLRGVSFSPKIEKQFRERTHKTDKEFWDPQLVKEDVYQGENSFDAVVRNAIRTGATNRKDAFMMLVDDCSVPWKLNSVSWTPNESFCITPERFASIYRTSDSGLPAKRAKAIAQFWDLVAFADPSAAREFLFDPTKARSVLQLRLGGRRYPYGDDHSQLYDRLHAAAHSRIGVLPRGVHELRYEPARFQKYIESLERIVKEMPARMAAWVSVACTESSRDATRSSFLVDTGILMARHGLSETSWADFDFQAALPLDELCLLARWAQSFLSTGRSRLEEKLGRKPRDDEATRRVIEEATRPVPTEFSWLALAEGAEISPTRVKDLIRWASKEDACGKGDPWKFTATLPSMVALRFP